MPKLNDAILEAAIEGFESQKRRIDQQIAELRAMLRGGSVHDATTPEAAVSKQKKFSAAARRKMALAQKARWARIRGESTPSASTPAEAPKPKRKLSAAGRKAIQEALRRRWALRHAEAARVEVAAEKSTPARKKAAVKKAAVKTPSAKAAKKVPVKKAATKTALAPAPVEAAQ